MNEDQPDPDKTEALLSELIKRGATMEQIALLKDPTANSSAEAIEVLKAGNARFLSGRSQGVARDINERRAQIMTQTPFAIVLSCSDSRVPTEIIFDMGPGDLFGIRVAGHVITPGALGSIEYAVRHLKVYLILVLGHEGCGAVAAAMQTPQARIQEPEHVQYLLERIAPAVEGLPEIRDGKARMREAIVRNVWHQKAVLERNPVVAEAVRSGHIQVHGAFYEIGSGAVDFLEEDR